MTALLDRVNWRNVLTQLVDGRAQEPGDDLVWTIRHRGPLLRPRHAMLAALAVQHGDDALQTILGERVGCWLYWTARTALGTLALPAPDPRVPRFTPPMFVDPHLPPLPMLALAGAWAQRESRRLLVRRVWLGPVVGGRCSEHSGDILIEVSPTAANPAAVWGHEWAHALDPHARGPMERERFADALGAALLSSMPATVDELDRLIEQADTPETTAAPVLPKVAAPPASRHKPTNDLPEPGMASVLAFAALPLHTEE